MAVTAQGTALTPSPPTLRVRLVQDADPLRDALQRCLEAEGLQVEACAVGDAAVGDTPDLLLLSDVAAPLELVAALRSVPRMAAVPILLLARQADATLRWPLVAAGADEVVAEDAPMQELIAAIRARVRRASLVPASTPAIAEDAAPRRDGALRRGEFLAQLALALADASPWQVLMAVRLDQAHALAESIGRAAAFELEQAVAARLAAELASADAYTLWMEFGFGLLLRRESRADIEALAARLCAAVAGAPFVARGQALALTVSVGIALAPGGSDAGDPDRWFGSAHAAQSIAHRLGGNRFEGVLSRDHGDMPPERVLIIREWVKEAVGGQNVVIEFQPAIPLQDGHAGLYSLQAKLRDYRAPLAGVARRDYLVLAREAGAIQMIDRMSLFAAFEAIEDERARGLATRLLVPVDLASVDEAALRWLEAETRRRRAHAEGLLLELDAGLALARPDLAAVVRRLEAQGMAIAIAGSSADLDNMDRLQRLPAGLLRLPLAAVDRVGGPRFQELLAPWRANGRELLVDQVEDVTRVRSLWQLQASLAQGDALAASSPRLDYEFAPFGA